MGINWHWCGISTLFVSVFPQVCGELHTFRCALQKPYLLKCKSCVVLMLCVSKCSFMFERIESIHEEQTGFPLPLNNYQLSPFF